MSPIDAPCCCECFGTLAITVGLTVGEFSPVSVRVAVVKREVRDDRWDPSVSDSAFKMIFFPFSELNE